MMGPTAEEFFRTDKKVRAVPEVARDISQVHEKRRSADLAEQQVGETLSPLTEELSPVNQAFVSLASSTEEIQQILDRGKIHFRNPLGLIVSLRTYDAFRTKADFIAQVDTLRRRFLAAQKYSIPNQRTLDDHIVMAITALDTIVRLTQNYQNPLAMEVSEDEEMLEVMRRNPSIHTSKPAERAALAAEKAEMRTYTPAEFLASVGKLPRVPQTVPPPAPLAAFKANPRKDVSTPISPRAEEAVTRTRVIKAQTETLASSVRRSPDVIEPVAVVAETNHELESAPLPPRHSARKHKFSPEKVDAAPKVMTRLAALKKAASDSFSRVMDKVAPKLWTKHEIKRDFAEKRQAPDTVADPVAQLKVSVESESRVNRSVITQEFEKFVAAVAPEAVSPLLRKVLKAAESLHKKSPAELDDFYPALAAWIQTFADQSLSPAALQARRMMDQLIVHYGQLAVPARIQEGFAASKVLLAKELNILERQMATVVMPDHLKTLAKQVCSHKEGEDVRALIPLLTQFLSELRAWMLSDQVISAASSHPQEVRFTINNILEQHRKLTYYVGLDKVAISAPTNNAVTSKRSSTTTWRTKLVVGVLGALGLSADKYQPELHTPVATPTIVSPVHEAASTTTTEVKELSSIGSVQAHLPEAKQVQASVERGLVDALAVTDGHNLLDHMYPGQTLTAPQYAYLAGNVAHRIQAAIDRLGTAEAASFHTHTNQEEVRITDLGVVTGRVHNFQVTMGGHRVQVQTPVPSVDQVQHHTHAPRRVEVSEADMVELSKADQRQR